MPFAQSRAALALLMLILVGLTAPALADPGQPVLTAPPAAWLPAPERLQRILPPAARTPASQLASQAASWPASQADPSDPLAVLLGVIPAAGERTPAQRPNGHLRLHLGAGLDLDVVGQPRAERADGREVWVGKVTDDPASEVVLTSDGGQVSGQVRYHGHTFRLISPAGAGELPAPQ